MARSVIEALPKTYHHPIGPAAPRGIGWVSIGRMLARNESRASSHRPTGSSSRLIIGPSPSRRAALVVLQGRVMGRPDFQPAVADPPRAREKPAGRRPRGSLAVCVIDAPVARAHEQTGLGEPFHRAAQMG